MTRDAAQNPLNERYASKEMSYLFSADYKFRTWRKLWIALAEAEKELGLAISDAQIAELRAVANDINYADAERREREIRHDVMSHIYAFGLQAPSAKGIIHLGATSAFVTGRATSELQQSRKRVEALNADIRQLEKENARLRAEIDSVKKSTFAVERIAREELGMSKRGEVIYLLPANSQPR